MQFFKHQHVIKKLREDSEKLDKTMDYIDERLGNPCEIYDIEKSWPAEIMLNKEIRDVEEKRNEIVEFCMSYQANTTKIKTFRKGTARFLNNVDAILTDIHNQLTKYGMKPKMRVPIPDTQQENVVKSLENKFEEACSL